MMVAKVSVFFLNRVQIKWCIAQSVKPLQHNFYAEASEKKTSQGSPTSKRCGGSIFGLLL